MRPHSGPGTAERVLDHMTRSTDAHGEVACTARGIGDALGIDATTANRAIARLIDTDAVVLIRAGTSYPAIYRVLRAVDEAELRRALRDLAVRAVA